MRTLRVSFTALVALLTWLPGCTSCDQSTTPDAGPIDAGPPILAEKEPNDGPQQALVIDRSSIVEGNLGANPAKLDEDWYVLKAGLPRTVELSLSCPPGADVALDVVDDAGNVLLALNAGGVDQPERFPNLDVSGKTFVRVTGVKKGTGGAYRLVATFRERVPGFELEPNDRQVDATGVPLGQAVSGFLAHANDQDWYRFELPSAEADAGGGPDDAGAADAADAGLPDASADASVESLGTTGTGTRPPGRDAGAPAEPRLALRVDISGVEGVAFELQVLTEAQAVLFAAKSKEGAGLSLRNVGARANDRVLYVVVKSLAVGKDAKRGANPDTYYTLTVAPEDSGGSAEFEPNDEPSRATELPPNGYREGFIALKGDIDFYRLTTDGPSIAKLQLTGVDKVDLVLAVVTVQEGKQEETVLKANEGGVKEPELLNDVYCESACFVKVEAAAKKVDGKWVKEDENGDVAYRLSAKVVPDDGTEEREPDNTAAQATPLTLGKPIRGTVYPKKDVDYFQLDLRARAVKTPLVATLLGVLKVDVGLYLHRVEADGKLTLVQTADGAKGEKPEVVRFSAEPGLYVFEVRDVKNREANFQDSYQLTVEESGE